MKLDSVKRFVRFGLAGGINTAVTYVIFLIALTVTPYPIAYSIAFATGIGISYLLNSTYVFGASPSWSKGWTYGLIYVIQYGLGLALIAAQVELVGIAPRWASLVAIAILAPLNYTWARLLLTKQPTSR